MKTAIRENLEFITDRYLLRQGVDKTSYQYNLIKVSGIPYATAIANNFNFSHLKKRIIMMNSKKSSSYQLVRYLVLGLLVGGTVLSLNYTKAPAARHGSSITDTIPAKNPAPQKITVTVNSGGGAEPVYVVDGKVLSKAKLDAIKPSDIATINVVKNPTPEMKENLTKEYGANVNNGVVFVQLKQSSHPIGIVIKDGKTDGKSTIPADVLVIVNGVARPKGKGYSDIPAETIESINVLKGENARAIYGEAAENGVIVITTKDANKIEVRILPDSTKTK